ncbi:YkgJ family cysteine cluster protein [Pseudodesulfovibrio piezophilus]|uniref:YkgJ family cysteine cluster protein n=1 Tax=Pseudodesulfovibrio piezophilus (strain DSM 21447 / JCM 15486 / C1TLV30) TaxID=1322246 RepID=M1WMJ0_PSEP2|nr:YkgJ family cysteine cluster protein [Pseudodesulfovibrio piezophilus]CCH49690.1 conserved protein of unknown function [Pseudodesulfovibrio piezophilus C1TLV30]
MDFIQLYRGLFRRFRSFVLGRDVEIVGHCLFCGKCCHDILLKDGHWLKKMRDFEKLCAREPEHKRFIPTGRGDLGHLVFRCSMQGDDGLCVCYENRLPLCRNYPSESIYYKGGWIRPDCGFRFKSTTFRDILMRRRQLRMPKFSDVLKQEIKQADK